MPLKIGYISNTNHSWCTEVHIARELQGMGHEVTTFQEPSQKAMGARFLRNLEHWCRSYSPDLVMFTRTWGLPPETTQLWRRLEARGIVTCSYHLDLYVGLQREAGIDNDPFWTTQFVFTPDGDPKSAEFFASRGINHHWSPPAVVSDECVPGTWQDRYDYDVVFVGSYGYHDEWKWRPTLIDFLAERYGPRFRRFGGDQPEGPTRGKDLNDLYATARIVVGDSLCLPGHERYFSDRYFETVGRGGFLIGPRVPGIEDFLQNGNHFVAYEYPKDRVVVGDGVPEALEAIAHQIDYRLGEDIRRQRIATQGQAHVARYHTYRNRLSAALAVMGFGGVVVDTPDLLIIDDPVKTGQINEKLKDATFEWYEGLDPKPIIWSIRVVEPIEKLELGAGHHPTPGFTTLDLNPACHPDIVGPAWPLELPDESVGEIRAVDVLEHESWQNTAAILADWFRVLRPGGKLYCQLPNADTIFRWYVEHPERLVDRTPVYAPQTALGGATWRLLGGHADGDIIREGQDWRLNAHYALFSRQSLTDALEAAGFVVDSMEENNHPNLMAFAHRPA